MRLVGTLDLPVLVSNATILPLRFAEINELLLHLMQESQQRYITHTDPLQSPTAGLLTNNIT